MNYLTPEQVTERLPRFNAAWVRRALRTGQLRGSRIGGRWLVPEDAIDELVESGSNAIKPRKRRRRAS